MPDWYQKLKYGTILPERIILGGDKNAYCKKRGVVCDRVGSLLWNYGTVRAFGGMGVAKKNAFFAYNEAHACVLLVGRALRVLCVRVCAFVKPYGVAFVAMI